MLGDFNYIEVVSIVLSGQLCELDIDECASNPCRHEGTCHDKVNGFECECPHGYYDYLCESDINECHSNPCQRGRCVDGINRFVAFAASFVLDFNVNLKISTTLN